jgi:hypothetical protein
MADGEVWVIRGQSAPAAVEPRATTPDVARRPAPGATQ